MGIEIRRDGEGYFRPPGWGDGSSAWRQSGGLEDSAELTPLPDASGFVIDAGVDAANMNRSDRIVYNATLKRFDPVRNGKEPLSFFRAPPPGVSRSPSSAADSVPRFVVVGPPLTGRQELSRWRTGRPSRSRRSFPARPAGEAAIKRDENQDQKSPT